ncbi:Zinc finger, BED-type predicted [Penicillium digitatum]|uniref:Zinc finger, BED-type predicted n=1 Tax=Penicillium digitatum TaxID=36651 RepID=A0A7T6XVM8_PENDI|nr:Zinc finger, BED-type predicted [Penicillium digitatum]QQK47998.1 Zinc finger, BED-type predicted [Penicillium digitatum]
MSHNDFVDWWLETDYGRKSKLKWDSNRHTEIWNSYHQVAQGIDGAPKVMCKRCGKILEHPYTLSPNSTGKAQYHGTSTIQKHRKTAGCLRSEKGKKAEITNFLQREGEVSASIPFLQEDWEEDLLQFLTLNRLPFHLIEHPSFKRIINKARSAPSPPVIPSADTIRRRLGSLVKDRQQRILPTALQQALSDDTIITRIPCLAHVIQLSLNQLLARIKAVPLNESAETRWTEKQSRLAQENAKQSQISSTLNKM